MPHLYHEKLARAAIFYLCVGSKRKAYFAVLKAKGYLDPIETFEIPKVDDGKLPGRVLEFN